MTITELLNQWPTVKEKCIQRNVALGGSAFFMSGAEYDELTVSSHAKKTSRAGFNCSNRCLCFSSGVSPSKLRSMAYISLIRFTPFAAFDVDTSSLSVGNASTNFLLACARQPHLVTFCSLLTYYFICQTIQIKVVPHICFDYCAGS